MEKKIVNLNSTLEKVRQERARRGPSLDKAPLEERVQHCTGWICKNCQIQDPTAPGGVLTFDLYDYQREFVGIFLAQVDRARRGEPAGVRTEKSRQMGDSWLMMALELYTLRFWPHFRALNISCKEQRVDDGGRNSTTDSLHGKIRFMHERLPEEERFPLEIKHLSLVNPQSGATIIGETANPNAGRGGTFLYGLWDETAATEHSFAIASSFEHAVRCPHYLSTPQGKSNFFAYSSRTETLHHVRHHWTMHPVKGEGKHQCQGGMMHASQSELCPGGEWRSPWYDEQCKRLRPEQVAQELDISYERSISGRAFPEFDEDRHATTELEVEPGGVFVASIDPGVTTAAAVLLQFVDTPGVRECRVMDVWKGHDATASTYAGLIGDWKGRFGKMEVTGDPSGFNRDLAYGRSVFGELRERYDVTVVPPPRTSDVPDRVRLVRDFMAERDIGQERKGRFAYHAALEEFARDLEEAKWPTDRDGRVTRETDLEHNEAEHTADALAYGVAYFCHRSIAVPSRPSRALHRPLTAGLINMEF